MGWKHFENYRGKVEQSFDLTALLRVNLECFIFSLYFTNTYECFQSAKNCKRLINMDCVRFQAGRWRLLVILLYR